MPEHYLEILRIGRALASQSHELKNVLAICGESAGLMEDLFEMLQSEGVELPENLRAAVERSLNSIQTQVGRGHRLCTDVNTMAHMSDWRQEGVAPQVDAGEVAMLAVRFMERPARQNEVTLIACEPCGHTVTADPLACLTAFMALLESAWQSLAAASELRVRALAGEPAVELECDLAVGDISEEARKLAAQAGLDLAPANGRLRATLKEGVS